VRSRENQGVIYSKEREREALSQHHNINNENIPQSKSQNFLLPYAHENPSLLKNYVEVYVDPVLRELTQLPLIFLD
jgi:hypothetical protein